MRVMTWQARPYQGAKDAGLQYEYDPSSGRRPADVMAEAGAYTLPLFSST